MNSALLNKRNEFLKIRSVKFSYSQFHKGNAKGEHQGCQKIKTVEPKHFFSLQYKMIKSDEHGRTTDYFKNKFHYFLRFWISVSTIFFKSSNSFSDKSADEVKKDANCKGEFPKKFLINPFICREK